MYDRFFCICSINFHNVLTSDITTAEKINFDSDFPSPCFDISKTWDFTSSGVQNRETKTRRQGMIVMSFQDSNLCEKQISQSFSYCELLNLPRNSTKVHYKLAWTALFIRKWEMSEKSVFLKTSSLEMTFTIIPSLLFLVSQFCTPPEVKFHIFGTSKRREGKSLSNLFLAILIGTLWRFYQANTKTVLIHLKPFFNVQ